MPSVLLAMGKPVSHSRRKSRFALSWRQWAQVAVVALLLLGGSGYLGWRWLQGWRYDKAIRDTQDFLRLGDPRSAVFAARRATQVRGDSVEAARLLAEGLEKTGSVEAVVWRRRVAELVPGAAAEQVALAAAAVRFRDPQLARSALEKVTGPGREQIDFLHTAAEVALALGDSAEAERYLQAILQLNPDDRARRVKLANLQIASPDPEVAAGARSLVEELKDDPTLRLVALRILLRDATRANAGPSLRLELSARSLVTQAPVREDPRLIALAEELLAEEDATLEDGLSALEVLRQMRGVDLGPKFDRLQTVKFLNAAQIGDAMLWLTQRGLAERAIEWSEKLPDAVRTTPPVQLAIVDAWIAQKEWGLVQAMVEETDWGELEAERLTIASIAWRLAGEGQRADASWNLAGLRLKQDASRLRRLADLCVRWGAESEKEKLWWKLAGAGGDQSPVLQRLFTLALQRKDGASLYRVVKALHEARPEDLASMNNYAWLSLLRQEDLARAHGLAGRVFAAAPTIGAYVSTYAYSQHLQGRTAEGLAAIEAAPSTCLRDPTVAGCYGFLLAAAGQPERAQAFLGVARRSPDLLPEEARLFLGTRDRIDRSLEVPELRLFAEEP